MRKYLERLPKEILDVVYLAGGIASEKNLRVYLVGGFVRDLILGVKNLDVDIVVEGDGIRFAEELAKRLNVRLISHRRFGTATVFVSRHFKIDIATARKESYPAPASLPVVVPGNLREDLARRDFTINAMAIAISVRHFGQFIDFFGGRKDLRSRSIRILHAASFIDDPLRILRAIRFEQRYRFRIEAFTRRCLNDAVKLRMLEKIGPQRTRDELLLLLKERHPLSALRRLQKLAGLTFLHRKLRLTPKIGRLLDSVEKQVDWFQAFHGHRRPLDAWLLYFLGLTDTLTLHDIGSLCRKFVFLRGEEKRIVVYKKIHSGFIRRLSKTDLMPSRVCAMLEPLSYEAILMLLAKHRNVHLKRHIEDFLRVYNDVRIHVSGHDLKDLGIAAGPEYQKIFAKVLNARLNGKLHSKEDELQFIKRLSRLP